MKAKKILSLVMELVLVLCFSGVLFFSGSRQRTTYAKNDTAYIDNGQQDDSQENTQQDTDNAAPPPEASPEVVPETHLEASVSHDAVAAIEVPAASADQSASTGNQSGESQDTAGDTGADEATVTQPTDDGGQTKPSGEGGSVETITDKYADFLDNGVGQLYPCQVCYIYVEGEDNYQTFSRGSEENKLVLQSGCFNVAEKLGDNTTVDDSWVIKKNPELIVKFVSTDVLGSTAENTDAAKEICSAIRARPGWDTTRALVDNRILILSRELMDSDAGKLAAKLYIASTLYPTLFSSLDINTMCNELFGDGGIYAYCSGQPYS